MNSDLADSNTNPATPLELPTPEEALKLNSEFWAKSQEKLITTVTELLTQKIIAEVIEALNSDNLDIKIGLFTSPTGVRKQVQLGEHFFKPIFSATTEQVLKHDSFGRLNTSDSWNASTIPDTRAHILFSKDGVSTVLKGIKDKINTQGWNIDFHKHDRGLLPYEAILSVEVKSGE